MTKAKKDDIKDRPLLSLVVPARNDNHGGDMLVRMQAFVNGFMAQSQRHEVRTELIIVDWNPPEDRPALVEDLSFPKKHDWCTVRSITVPTEVHNKYKYAGAMGLYQMIGKNVGIRRAHGEYILATNIDILFSDELFDYFAQGKLQPNRMYRVDRYDVDNKLPEGGDFGKVMDYCRKNLLRINSRYGTFATNTGSFSPVYPMRIEEQTQRYKMFPALHTNACGDFQLMHRDNWFDLRGYPEFDIFSFHLDSVMLFAAHFGGAPEYALTPPMVTYHIEHGSGFTPETSAKLEKRLKETKLRRISDDELFLIANWIAGRRRKIVFNDENWGLAEHDFKDEIIVKAQAQGKPIKNSVTDKTPEMAIITVPRAFTGTDAVNQKNAISSWTNIRPRPEVILLGRAEGTAKAAKELGVKHIPEIRANRNGVYLVPDAIKKAKAQTKAKLICWAEPSTLLTDDLATAAARAGQGLKSFVMTGQRLESDIQGAIDFASESWRIQLFEAIAAARTLYNEHAPGYMLWTRDMEFNDMPSFSCSDGVFCEWMVRNALCEGFNVVDTSSVVPALELKSIISKTDNQDTVEILRRERKNNTALAGIDILNGMGKIENANWKLTFSGLRQRYVFTPVNAAPDMTDLSDFNELFFKYSDTDKPHLSKLWLSLANLKHASGAPDAKFCYVKTLEALATKENKDCEEILETAIAYYRLHMLDEAARWFVKILNRKDVTENMRWLVSDFLTRAAIQEGHRKKPVFAHQVFNRLLMLSDRYPAYEKYLLQMAVSAFNNDYTRKLSEGYFRALLNLRSPATIDKAEVLFYLGESCRINRRDYRHYHLEALNILQTKKTKSDKDLYFLCTIYKRLNDTENARLWAEKLLKNSKSTFRHAGALYHLGDIEAMTGSPDRAREELFRCMWLNPFHSEVAERLTSIVDADMN